MGAFVTRPVFAMVIAIIISLLGVLASRQLAVEQYPTVAPPQVKVTAVYPGASPEILETTVASALEREMNGIEGLLYQQSTSSANGSMQLSIYFEPGTDLDMAAVEVNNRVKRVEALLPQEVLRQGLRVDKTNPQILLLLALQSNDPNFDPTYLANLANSSLINELKRIPGVGDVTLFAAPYAMRIWVDPGRLAKFNLTVNDVSNAVREQNQNFAVGEIGKSPNREGQVLTFPVQTQGGLVEAEAFREVIIRAMPDGSVVRVRDIGRVELGAAGYEYGSRLNGEPAVSMAIYLSPGANALALSEAVHHRMDELSVGFPSGIEWSVPYDTTKFVEASIHLVLHTFVEAFVLVLLVVFVFIGNFRATFIPMIAIPISIVGTLAGMLVLGFSINMLTLFGMVLAIGIVVDDAIVVVEAVERLMHEKGLAARDAAIEAMRGIGSAIIGVTAVMCAVFVPIAFLGGVTGTLYKQFAITIAISTVLSAVVALTLTPALCALLLKSGVKKPRLIQAFDRFFEKVTGVYVGGVRFLITRLPVAAIIYAAILAVLILLFKTLPTGFVPDEDKGTMLIAIDLPSGASALRTAEALEQTEAILLGYPEVESTIAISGFSIFYSYANQAFIFATLKDWDEREEESEKVFALLQRANRDLAGIVEARVFAMNEPAISGMGAISGFDYRLLATDGDRAKLDEAARALVAASRADPALQGVRNVAAPDVQTLFLDVDRNKAKAMGVPLNELYSTIGGLLGSTFINQFNAFGTNLRVLLQAEAEYRSDPSSLDQFFVRNQAGTLVPVATLATADWRSAPIALNRYNGYPSVQISGAAAPGYSSGEALATMARLSADILPAGVTFEWSGQSLQESQAGSQTAFIFGLSFLFVFLFLAALYESWSLPVAVFLIVPIAIAGALVAIWVRGTNNDIFFQVSLITLVGLAGKNGILIVEFAKQEFEAGKSALDAALEAARQRLRPIVMTSLAFILGVLPLVKAAGAGAATQHSVGTGILGGMLAATLIGIFFTPLFFWFFMKGKQHPGQANGKEAVS
jgi:hydrophobe/amphiphile efflux-1 (HAE1) family protein